MSDFDFLDINASDIVQTLVQGVENQINEPLYPGDERRIFLEAVSVVVVGMIQKVNDDCKQRLLNYARGPVLDELGERLAVQRLEATPAQCTLRFSLAEARTRQTFIPAGTRATPDGQTHFATTVAATIPDGETYIDVLAECTVGGSANNGFDVGTISTLTDQIAYISGVSNLDASAGGDDGEPSDYDGPGDQRYRERIRLAPAKLSTAGPRAAYEYWAKSANSTITDVRVPADHDAGTVDIIVLTESGMPSDIVLADVLSACNDEKIRPMNDLVTASAPTGVNYDINIKYYVTAENEASAVTTIEGDGGSIDQFIKWQDTSIGRDINPDQLRAFVLAPKTGTGALRMTVTAPAFTVLTDRQVAQFSGNLTITHEVTAE